ncbi:agmatine deiminase family protein [Zunongwangia sp. F363]|uniref:Agmatine deiminase family protein n=1 Tax=Autumnicola tepida TaxID=3075595 RepID=A0ABU3C663_9FLAO|nr:agmatine deiminase family protein [Zunongwangia sp. F363]MDT0641822.1 agmatine deiminase family protein [Zunongwangia sp. F363]
MKKAKLENGKDLKIIELQCRKIFGSTECLAASYANFIILNKCVLVPTFNDAKDRKALSIFEECFPGRKVIGISCIDFIWGFGTLYCLSQQIPQ